LPIFPPRTLLPQSGAPLPPTRLAGSHSAT
jgi:hypothetical protein